jgi:DNA recombination-dependent growth factor C
MHYADAARSRKAEDTLKTAKKDLGSLQFENYDL